MENQVAELNSYAQSRKKPYKIAEVPILQDSGETKVREIYWKRPTRAEFQAIITAQMKEGAEQLEVLDLMAELCLVRSEGARIVKGIPQGYIRLPLEDPLDLRLVYEIDIESEWTQALRTWGFDVPDVDENGEVVGKPIGS